MKLLILALLTILSSCGGEKTQRTLEVSFGALSATAPSYIYGQKIDGSEKFGKRITGDRLDIPLTSGSWRFQVIVWNTSSNSFEGDPVCGEAKADLTSGASSVVLNVSAVNCKSTSWFGSVGYYESTSLIFYGVNFNICESGTGGSVLTDFPDCPAFYSGVTGLKVMVPELSLTGPVAGGETVSACFTPGAGNSFYTMAKIPVSFDPLFPMHTMVKLYHGVSGCSGAECCSGLEETYHFPNGLGNPVAGGSSAAPKSGSSVKVKFVKKLGDHLAISAPSAAPYGTCSPFAVTFNDKTGTSKLAASNLTVELNCDGKCTFHNNNSCSSSVSTLTIPAGSSSVMGYVSLDGYKAPIKVTATDLPPAQKTIAVNADFSTIDANYLFSASYIGDISWTYFFPPSALAKTVLYDTQNGNRGKMYISSISTTTDPTDTFTFDFVTYNSSGAVVASGTNVTFTACFSGPCFLDMDVNTPVLSTSTPGVIEAWWENLSGSLYFNPQSVSFVVLP